MAKIYTISGVRLSGIADQVRRIAEISDRLSPAGIEETLEGIEPGGGSDYMIRHIVSQGDDAKGITGFQYLEPASMYYYGGILLPKLPQDILSEYPYCFIRNSKDLSQYTLYLSSTPWFQQKGTSTGLSVLITDSWQEGVYKYEIAYADAGNAVTWTSSGLTIAETYNVNSRPLIWTNQNITTVDSASAGAVIYYWSMPVVPGEG